MNNHSEHSSLNSCENFQVNLDLWLAKELSQNENIVMQTHHDSCPDCQLEAKLALSVEAITHKLPELTCPQIQPEVTNHSWHSFPAGELFERLLNTWRQPLVLVPACALVLASILIINLSRPAPGTAESQIIVVNGKNYTQEEIIKAVEDLELALKYVGKYSSYPSQIVRAEIKQSHLPLPSQENIPNTAI